MQNSKSFFLFTVFYFLFYCFQMTNDSFLFPKEMFKLTRNNDD